MQFAHAATNSGVAINSGATSRGPDTDILTIRLDPGESQLRNEYYSSDSAEVVFDIDGDDRLAGIDILDASKCVNLQALLPIVRETEPATAR